MSARTLTRWAIGGGLLAAGAFLTCRDASADHRLKVYVSNSNLNQCEKLDTNHAYMGEAWGFDVNGSRQCEAMAINGTAMTMCPTSAIEHLSLISLRETANADLGLLTQFLAISSTLATTWSSTTTVGYNIPPNSFCTSGASISAESAGTDTATP